MMSYEEEIILVSEDFPWLEKTNHPDDYIESTEPMEPEYIYHHIRGKHNRLWLRISWKLADNKFMPISFLLDTGAPKHFYLTQQALSILEKYDLTCVDDDTNVEYTTVFGRKCLIEVTPDVHKPANIIGLKMLKRFGLQLYDDEPHFSLNNPQNIRFISK